jgi:hypothetical protein
MVGSRPLKEPDFDSAVEPNPIARTLAGVMTDTPADPGNWGLFKEC